MTVREAPPPIAPCPMCKGRVFAALPSREAWVCAVCHPMCRDDVVTHVVPEPARA